MPSAADRHPSDPQHDAGNLRAFGLALLVHLLLLGALTWGVNWKHSNPDISFDAELWSSVPQEAAPKPVETAPPPPPSPAPEPVVKAPPPAPTPDVDIALEREKKRKLELKKKEAELAEAKKEQERLKELQAKKEKEQKAKDELAKRKAEELKKAEAKKQDTKEQEKQKLAEAAAEKQRQENIRRIAGLAGATGSADAKGSAQKAGGPSAGYGGKVKAKVKSNIVFTEDVPGNPTAEVEVRTSPDGTIMSQRLIKSSGNKAWDEAVIRAIIRTETMPRDVDGRVPTPMILELRRND
jgi:colicin import membrane protein